MPGKAGRVQSSGTEFCLEDVFVEPDQVRFANANCGCAHITGWAKHGCDGIAADIRFHVKLADFLALHGNQFIGRGQQRFGIGCLKLFAGEYGFINGDIAGFQELGCFGAGRSSLAEVIPVGFFAHVFLRVAVTMASLFDD